MTHEVETIIQEMRIPYNSTANVMDIYNGIIDYCTQNHTRPRAHKWAVNCNNILTVDGEKYLRVGPLVYASYLMEPSEYEEAIMARQEQYMPD